MNNFRKNHENKIIGIIFYAVAFCFCFAFFAIFVSDYAQYEKYDGTFVKVNAMVSKVTEYYDSDDGDSYKIYLSYECGDKKYTDVYWMKTTSDDYSKGDILTVEVSSDNPEYINQSGKLSNQIAFIFVILSVVTSWFVYSSSFYKKGKTRDDRRILNEKMIIHELSPKAVSVLMNSLFGFGASMCGGAVFMSSVYTTNGWAEMFFAMGIIIFILLATRVHKVSKERIIIDSHRCKATWTESDGDTTSEYVQFEGIAGKSHGRKIYAHAQTDKTYYVLKNKKGCVREIYDVNEWAVTVDNDNLTSAAWKVVRRYFIESLVVSVFMFLVPCLYDLMARVFFGA